mgnify:CR=1 FL=1
MSENGIDNSGEKKPSNNQFNPLVDLLILLAKGLRNQTFIFVLAMGTLIILAYWFSKEFGSFAPLYFIVGSIVALAILALWVERIFQRRVSNGQSQASDSISSNTPKNKKKSSITARKASMSQFDKLRDWLDNLVDTEFRDMMNSLLTTQEITRLPHPLHAIDRGSFLGQMKVYNRLNEVEKYLIQKYPERFK